jgi:hypothetical protein
VFLFGVFLGDVRREFMQRLSAALHGTWGSYLRDALHEGNADAVACLPVPTRAYFILFTWWSHVLFLVKQLKKIPFKTCR